MSWVDQPSIPRAHLPVIHGWQTLRPLLHARPIINFQLLSPAEHGEEILIAKPGKPVALAMQAKG